jgi:glycine cleavage system H protein
LGRLRLVDCRAAVSDEDIRYQRSRFSTRLRADRLYTSGHYWLQRQVGDLWRVGLTRFALRMLGEVVELDFEVAPGAPVRVGQVIGWLEGFKAITDLYAILPGRFEGPNPELERQVSLVQTDPYGQGWLYAARGSPDATCVDAQRYAAVLDATIDKMLGERHG